MKFSRLYFTPLGRRISHRIFMLAAALFVMPFTMASEPDNRNNVIPEHRINPEQPFLVTIALKNKSTAHADVRELADSVGAKIIHENPLAAMYRLRLPTNSLAELGAALDKLEADPRVLKMKWDIY